MNPFQSVPPNVRVALYWAGYFIGIVAQATTIIWGAIAASSPDVQMPLGLVIASAVMAFLQTQLNLLAGSNVTTPREEVLVNPIRDERGVYSAEHALILALAVVGIVLIVLLLAGVL